ncbi:C-C motif chemokine 4 [Platysternon megacephalum]|uniref:C-C motif chemokine n=1 Tax=Platysternon megacephalum TaxID=55544 RepID=A0A4D9DQ94_9SAUR|nr:C-C motif chemokine 4 [Platysternon megacephalum]
MSSPPECAGISTVPGGSPSFRFPVSYKKGKRPEIQHQTAKGLTESLLWLSCCNSSPPDSNMKVSVAALAVLLIAAFCSLAFSAPIGSDPPTACCFSYTARQIPRNFVKDYYSTSSMCSQPGIVFITKRGRELCANPSESWVQEYVNDLELN